MSIVNRHAFRRIEHRSEDVAERLSEHLSVLRKEIGALAAALGANSGKQLRSVRKDANSLAHDAQAQLPLIAARVQHRALGAGHALRKDPMPAMVMVGTVALLASLLVRKDQD